MNELNKLYKAMLMSWGSVIKDDARIVVSINGDEIPVRIDDMDLYLPQSEVLDGNCIDKVFFHPACENVTSKETEVFKVIRRLSTLKLLTTFSEYVPIMFGVASKNTKQAWRQNILDMLEPLKSAKRVYRDELKKLFQQMQVEVNDNGVDNRFIHIKVTKGGGRGKTGEKVYYKAKPVFPFYNEIVKRLARSEGQSENQTVELNGYSVSIGALKLAAHLFKEILPIVETPDDLEVEATSQVAARLCAYLGCYYELAEQLNRIQNTFRADFDKAGVYPIDTNWYEHLDELPEIYRQVPTLDYNSHNTQDEEVQQSTTQRNNQNLFSVSGSGNRNQNNNNNQNNNQGNNNNNNKGGNNQANVVGGNDGSYDTTVPAMEYGDNYVKTEIDYMAGHVNHYAMNNNGNQVIYQCTRHGNVLRRIESSMNNMMGGMNNMMGGMGGMMGGGQQLANGMILLPNGMTVMPQQLQQMMRPSTAASAPGGSVDYSATTF
jgi:hypothetical protein